jgi:hypothetical protein
MTGLSQMNSAMLSQMLEREISDAVVLVAKNVIMGGEPTLIADALGCAIQEVQEVMESQDFKDVHLIMASHYNSQSLDSDFSYDDLENRALKMIGKRLDSEKDIDKLIRVASMANRAVRRHKAYQNDDTLDATNGGRVVKLTLSQRLVEKLNGTTEAVETRQISIKGGSLNPSFDELDKLLGVKAPRTEENYRIESEGEITVDAITRLINDGQ